MDTWQLVATERSRLAGGLSALGASEWNESSLCPGWRNRDVLAHVVSTAETTAGRFFVGMIRNGFRFHEMSANNAAALAGQSTEQLLDRLRAGISSHVKPPGPVASVLLEAVVHGEDVMHPLGKSIAHSDEGLVGALEFGKDAQSLVGCEKRIARLSLRATDVNWSTCQGPEVSGPATALLLAMCGRKAALDSLSGPGVVVLQNRP
jgi:uncharacterized protein (TIGR03083 family)